MFPVHFARLVVACGLTIGTHAAENGLGNLLDGVQARPPLAVNTLLARSSGGHLFAAYQITQRDNVYARYDQFNNDPVTGRNVRAFNFGYFRSVGEMSRLSFDYQFKNRPSFNDDAVNGRFHITWNIEF